MSGLMFWQGRVLVPGVLVGSARIALRLPVFVGVFALVGPLAGRPVARGMMAGGAGSARPFVAGAYPEGIWLALAVGVACGVTVLLSGKASWVIPVAVVIVVSAVFLVASVIGDLSRPDLMEACLQLTWVFFPPSLVATLVCWGITSRLLVSR